MTCFDEMVCIVIKQEILFYAEAEKMELNPKKCKEMIRDF